MDRVTLFALGFPALLLSFTVHEYAHAWVASRLGDATAERQGRLTFSPLAHIDPIGSVLLPAVAMLTAGIPYFAWAKPVPVNPANFRRSIPMGTGMVLVAVAGPGANLFLAVLASTALRAVWISGAPLGYINQFLAVLVLLNVVQFVFNLLPIPPLDGGRLIPDSWTDVKDFLSRYSFLVLAALFILPVSNGQSIGGAAIRPVIHAVMIPLGWIAGPLLEMGMVG